MQTEFKYSSVFDVFLEQVNDFSDKPYLIKKNTYSYKQVFNLSVRLALMIRNDESKTKTVVSALTCNQQIAICFWACMFNGYDLVLSGETDLHRQVVLENFDSNGIINISDLEEQFPDLIVDENREIDFYIKRSNNQSDVYFFSSGTTGKPKLIKNTSFQILNSLNYIHFNNSLKYLHTCSSVYLTMPLSHSYGLCSMLEYTMAASTLVLPQEQSSIGPVKALLRGGAAENVDSIEGVPYFYEQIFPILPKLKLHRIKHIGFGADTVRKPIIESLSKTFPGANFSIRYGISEIPSMISILQFNFGDEINLKLIPNPFKIYKAVVKSVDEHQEHDINYGQLCITTYLDQNTQTTIETGDLVTLHPDHMIFHGRLKNILKHKGYKMNALAIEERINLFAGVNTCRVFVNEKDTLKAEFISDKVIAISELINYLADFLPGYMIPEVFEQVFEFDRTISGKILRSVY